MGRFFAPAELPQMPPLPRYSVASLDTTIRILGAEAEILLAAKHNRWALFAARDCLIAAVAKLSLQRKQPSDRTKAKVTDQAETLWHAGVFDEVMFKRIVVAIRHCRSVSDTLVRPSGDDAVSTLAVAIDVLRLTEQPVAVAKASEPVPVGV